MVLFKKKKPGEHEITKEGTEDILNINYEQYPRIPSIEEDPIVMASVIEKLAQSPKVTRIIFHQKKKYEYGYNQSQILVEVAQIYNHFIKQKNILTQAALEVFGPLNDSALRVRNLQRIVLDLLRTDPVGAFVEVKRMMREERINLSKDTSEDYKIKSRPYLSVLTEIYDLMAKTKLIASARDYLDGYEVGNRDVYKLIFRPSITPDFMYTRLTATPPLDAEEIDSYDINSTNIQIFKTKETIKPLYHVIPPEFKISEDKYELIDTARKVLSEHQPKSEEFLDTEKMRETFFNIGRDLITELASHRGISLSFSEIDELAEILVRYTVGFGTIELLLSDPEIQDISINSPPGSGPMFVVHGKYDECVTNITPSAEDIEGWASRFRLISARPLDEANPVLDTEMEIPGVRARVAIITRPLNPTGTAFSIRRHRDKPWTLPLFINNNMINELAAGLLSFIIDGSRTLLIAGTRGSGKCLNGDTLIQLNDGEIVQIRQLVGEHKAIINDGNIYYPNKVNAISMNNLKLINSKISDVWIRSSPNKLVKIKTRSGREIITTLEHNYFVYNKKLDEIKAENIKAGDFIATPRKIIINNNKTFLILEKNVKFKFKEDEKFYYISGVANSQNFRIQKEITAEFAQFLGLIIGDGHIDLEKIEFFNKCKELREKYKIILKLFNLRFNEFESRTSIVIQTNCRNLSRILNEYFEIPLGKKADKVVIPKLILKSNNKILAAFLQGYFDTDGYTPELKKDIELCTASKLMANQLKLALLRFGIVSFYKEKIINNTPYYRIFIRGEFVNKFAEHIGFSHPFKKSRLSSLISLNILENTNVDIIPNGNNILLNLRKKLRITPKQHKITGKDCWGYESSQFRVSRILFRKIIPYYEIRYKELKNLQYQIDSLKTLTEFNYSRLLENTERIRILLGLSYGALASDLMLSETNVRKTLQFQQTGNIKKIKRFISLYYKYKSKWNKIPKLLNEQNLKIFIDEGFSSYVQISKNTNIKETTLKNYIYGELKVPEEQKIIIQKEINKIKQSLIQKLPEIKNLINELRSNLNILNGVQIGVILSNLRETLNVKNQELISDNVCLQTVTNFFTGTYQCNFKVTKSISKRMIEIYNSCINKETNNLLKEAGALASSDIFWDEIKSAQIISKTEDNVYDLTIEGTHNFIANGIIAHNTSIMGAVMTEIMRKYRIILVEDSVTGDLEIFTRLHGKIERKKIGELIDRYIENNGVWYNLTGHEITGNIENIEVMSMDKRGKIKWSRVSKFIRHKVKKPIYKVITRTGKIIKTTGDHSLFGLKEDAKIGEVKVNELKIGDFIATPRIMPEKLEDLEEINLIDYLEIFDKGYIVGDCVKLFLKRNKLIVKQLDKDYNHNRSLIALWIRKGIIPIKIIKDMKCLGHEINDLKNAYFKYGNKANPMSIKIKLDEKMLTFLGLWLADGCYDKNSVIISVVEEENRQIVREIAEDYGFNIKMHSDKFSLMANSKTLKEIMIKLFELRGNAYTKRIPKWCFNLSNRQIAALLKGIFSGDGHVAEKEIMISLCSRSLLEDIQNLMLRFGIILRIGNFRKRDKTYPASISANKFYKKYKTNIGILPENKKRNLEKLCLKVSSHDTTDVIPLKIIDKEKIKSFIKKFNHIDYINKGSNVGREKLGSLLEQTQLKDNFVENLRTLSESEIFWDEIKEIEIIKDFDNYVYDLSVPENESFIVNGIIAHNTLELPSKALADLGHNIQSMKVRSALASGGNELSAGEGIRTSLRMGDSALIVGEVRSTEALALYEAMRTGALANVVAGTIHGDSPYGVFDRVVNDLRVPRTSFKATDIIVVANPVRSADGLHKFRRVTQITEVRKEWENDPLNENGFVDLMKYDPKTDTLIPTDSLINGDSEIIKSIGANLKEMAGSWDAIWENILLRAKIKSTIVNYSRDFNLPDLMEAKAVTELNDEFHRISDQVREKEGFLNSKKIFFEWEETLKRYIKINFKN